MFDIINETKEEIKELADIKYVLEVAQKLENLDNIEFNVIIVDNEYIHNLNKEYRHIDRPTDVITFALEDYEDVKTLLPDRNLYKIHEFNALEIKQKDEELFSSLLKEILPEKQIENKGFLKSLFKKKE